MEKTCKKCSVTRSGAMKYDNRVTKTRSFVDSKGERWYGLTCSGCYSAARSIINKAYRVRVASGQFPKTMQSPLLGPKYAPEAPKHDCQGCGEKTINRYNCTPCLDSLGAGEELTYSIGLRGFSG